MTILVVTYCFSHCLFTMPFVVGLARATGGKVIFRASICNGPFGHLVHQSVMDQMLNHNIIISGSHTSFSNSVFDIVYAYNPDIIFWWNGLYGDIHALHRLKKLKPVFICEHGFLPQREHLFIDYGGINAGSLFRRTVSPPISDSERERLNSYLENFICRNITGSLTGLDDSYILVPLQLEEDTQITKYSPHFKRMVDFVQFVSGVFPQKQIVVRPHPLDGNEYESVWPNVKVVKEGSSIDLVIGAEAVVGINSTVLTEAVACRKPVAAVGLGIFTGKGVVLEAHQDPGRIAGVLSEPCDAEARERYLYDLLFRAQVPVGDFLPDGRFYAKETPQHIVREWMERNGEALGKFAHIGRWRSKGMLACWHLAAEAAAFGQSLRRAVTQGFERRGDAGDPSPAGEL